MILNIKSIFFQIDRNIFFGSIALFFLLLIFSGLGLRQFIDLSLQNITLSLILPFLIASIGIFSNFLVGASNQLGAFESGAAAALMGAVPAVVAGGALTIALAAVWPPLFPALARIDRLEDLRPNPVREPPAPPG